MRFSPGLLDEIRARVPLSEVVARRVSWDRRKSQPARGDFWACCPFHQEKTPSFHVDDRRNRYKCFGCGASGDHFRFLTETEGLSFPEAVERLAEQAGVALPAPDPQAAARAAERASLAEICEMAARFFQDALAMSGGEQARDYISRRRLRPDTVREFRIGYAPNGRDALKRHLIGKGVDEASMVEAGLVIRPDDGRPTYDRFRNRLMIPIQDERGRVIAFGGRTLDPDGQPKYLNSPETPLFHKGTMVFNFHRAREPAHRTGQAVVVEGYMDAIAIAQAGMGNVVAALGTAFTEEQVGRLWRLAPEPVICFDGDAAGTSAAHRAVDRILPGLRSGHSFGFVFLPDGKDPDDLIADGGLAAFTKALEGSQPLIDVLWSREVDAARIDTPERRAALEKSLDDLVRTIADERVRRGYQLDIRLRLSNLFYRQARAARGQGSGQGNGQGGGQGFGQGGAQKAPSGQARGSDLPESSMFGHERMLCGLCLKYPELLERHVERLSQAQFGDVLHARFRDELCRIATELQDVPVSGFFETLDTRFFQILSEALDGPEEAGGGGGRGLITRFHDLLQRLPILRHEPPVEFIEDLFCHYLDVLELRALEQDLEAELAALGDGLDEADWERIRAHSQDLARRREECARDEQEIAERGKVFRSARPVSSSPAGAAARARAAMAQGAGVQGGGTHGAVAGAGG
ncbi:DNA primase [Stappia sp. 28M-7]|uniref:DNA primase n=1 Tax=Stappia sp. 28M-7 TaxID=2762596 RepID=UPI00163D2961|nr:DNA primase [Stappia sp. 28M-7]MBC2860557.1 DNA primase [Stappia sp. 28M-7]